MNRGIGILVNDGYAYKILAPSTTFYDNILDLTALTIADINIPNVIGNPTHIDKFDEVYNHMFSSGVMHGCSMTDNLAIDGTIDIAVGAAILRAPGDDIGHGILYSVEVPETLGIVLADNAVNFIYVSYNDGVNIQVLVTQNSGIINMIDKVPVYVVVREGTSLSYIDSREQNVNHIAKNQIKEFYTDTFKRKNGGAIISDAGTLHLACTSGAFFFQLNEYPTPALDTTGTDTFEYYRHTAGLWVETNASTIDPDYYDNGTDLVAVGNNKYSVHWVYVVVGSNSHYAVIYSTAEYTNAASAETATVPIDLPPSIQGLGVLLGRVIVQQGTAEALDVETVYSTTFTSGVATSHNSLADLQGGGVDEYYHLTTAELAKLNGVLTAEGINLADSKKAYFGDSNDLSIFHDGINSYIHEVGTGALRILSNNFSVRNGANNAAMITAIDGGAVYLYHNGVLKAETNLNGFKVTGILNATSFTGDGSGLTGVVITVDTVAEMLTLPLAENTNIHVRGYSTAHDGGGALYSIVNATSEPSSFYKTLNNGKFAVLSEPKVNPLQVGYNIDVSLMTSVAEVDANWAIMKQLIADLKLSSRQLTNFDTILTMEQIYANWISGIKTPLGFYSDSTTDGYRTTGHVSSIGADSPFAVTINTSPNAYPGVLQTLATEVGPLKTTPHCYNGGFDSQSYSNGFGLKHWYNTWFRGLDGSNQDWSDVSAIILGFGTSDSANVDDTATVIANFSEAVECSIIDCFLRGVQPILQTPVTTTQHVGNGPNGRNADQTLTIINSVLGDLAKKYNLELLTYGEPQMEALDGFNSLRYGDIFNTSPTDRVHPLDLGHRIQASYLLTKMSNQIPKTSHKALNIFSGSPYYKVIDESLNLNLVAPDTILEKAITDYGATVERFGEFFYKFPATTAANTDLLMLSAYVTEPSVAMYMPIDSSVVEPSFLIHNVTHNDNDTIASYTINDQPLATTYTKMRVISNLRYGLNQIYIKSNAAGGQQKVGGLMIIPTRLLGSISFIRESLGGTVYLGREFNFPKSAVPSYNTYDIGNLEPIWMRYNSNDNSYSTIGFRLSKTFVTATDYEIHSHFNDHQVAGDCYNIFKINTDTLTVSKVVDGAVTQVGTVTTGGIGASLVAGAQVEIRIRTRFYLGNPSGTTNIQLIVDGVTKTAVAIPYGDLWTQGYGIVMNAIESNNISINSVEKLTGSLTNIR